MDKGIRKITGVIFDFEGTLVDFQWQLDQAVNETLSVLDGMGFRNEWYGLEPDYAMIFNITRSMAIKDGADISRALSIVNGIYDRYDLDALTRWSLYPETLHTLESLRISGRKLALVTNVGRAAMGRAAVKLNLLEFFQLIITRDDVSFIKPDPEGLLKAADALDMKPSQTLFTGDSRNDIVAARAAGMPVCYITGGERWPPAFPKSPVDLEISRLDQIIPALTEGEKRL